MRKKIQHQNKIIIIQKVKVRKNLLVPEVDLEEDQSEDQRELEAEEYQEEIKLLNFNK